MKYVLPTILGVVTLGVFDVAVDYLALYFMSASKTAIFLIALFIGVTIIAFISGLSALIIVKVNSVLSFNKRATGIVLSILATIGYLWTIWQIWSWIYRHWSEISLSIIIVAIACLIAKCRMYRHVGDYSMFLYKNGRLPSGKGGDNNV